MAKQTEISYEGKEWKSYQTGGTLVRATDLNNIENGIVEACAGVDELRTKRLPTYVVAQDGDTATQDVYSEDILGPCLILDLATRTTYYETGGEEGEHRKALVSGDEIDDIRDSVSQTVLWSGDATVGQTVEVPGIEDASLLKISLSNADPNDWWTLGVKSNPPSTGAYDFVIQCDVLTKQVGTYIFADATLEVTGNSVRVRGGTVVTGSSIGNMGSTQPLHLHEVTRLL